MQELRSCPFMAAVSSSRSCSFRAYALAQTESSTQAPAQHAAEISLLQTSAFPSGELTVPVELKSSGTVGIGTVAFNTAVSDPYGVTLPPLVLKQDLWRYV